jgi:hypothetical protein
MTMLTTKQFNVKVPMYHEVQILNMIKLSADSGTVSQHTTAMIDARGE